MSESVQLPFAEKLKAIPGFFGIRLEEKPAYEVIESVGDVEIRRYAQSLLAEITLPGNHDQAVDAAFDRLARYIFGENSEHEQMSMTNPVYQREARQPSAAVPLRRRSNAWTIAFFLANDMLPVEAPKPNDPAIELVVEPEHVVASLRAVDAASPHEAAQWKQLHEVHLRGRLEPTVLTVPR